MYAAIDIGGTKTLVAVFDNKKNIIKKIRFSTPVKYVDFIEELKRAHSEIENYDFRRGVTAVPGQVDRKNGIGIALGNLPWKNFPIDKDAERIFKCPMNIENDANLAGLAEASEVDSKYKTVLYITISTGIGGGYISNGVIDERFRDAEIGHMKFEHNGRYEYWEDFASGSAIYKKYGKKASEITSEHSWGLITKNMSVGILNLIAIMNPDLIIIGGGIGTHFDKFGKELIVRLKKQETPMVHVPPIIKAKHPEEAVLYGCYEFARQHEK